MSCLLPPCIKEPNPHNRKKKKRRMSKSLTPYLVWHDAVLLNFNSRSTCTYKQIANSIHDMGAERAIVYYGTAAAVDSTYGTRVL